MVWSNVAPGPPFEYMEDVKHRYGHVIVEAEPTRLETLAAHVGRIESTACGTPDDWLQRDMDRWLAADARAEASDVLTIDVERREALRAIIVRASSHARVFIEEPNFISELRRCKRLG